MVQDEMFQILVQLNKSRQAFRPLRSKWVMNEEDMENCSIKK